MPDAKYHVRVDQPGLRWKITKSLAGAVTVYFVRREPGRVACSCPGYRRARPCKHCRYIANLVGQPGLAASAADLAAAF